MFNFIRKKISKKLIFHTIPKNEKIELKRISQWIKDNINNEEEWWLDSDGFHKEIPEYICILYPSTNDPNWYLEYKYSSSFDENYNDKERMRFLVIFDIELNPIEMELHTFDFKKEFDEKKFRLQLKESFSEKEINEFKIRLMEFFENGNKYYDDKYFKEDNFEQDISFEEYFGSYNQFRFKMWISEDGDNIQFYNDLTIHRIQKGDNLSQFKEFDKNGNLVEYGSTLYDT